MSDILTEYERDYYLLDDELEPVALRKNEFVIRDSSFANHGIEDGYIIKYDPDEFYFRDFIEDEYEDEDYDETEY